MTSLTKAQKGEGTKWTLEEKEEKEGETVGGGRGRGEGTGNDPYGFASDLGGAGRKGIRDAGKQLKMESPGPVPSPSMSPLLAQLPLGVRSGCRPPASSKIAIPSVCPAVPDPEIDDTGNRGADQAPSAQGTAKVRADWTDIESEARGGSWPRKPGRAPWDQPPPRVTAWKNQMGYL